MLCKGAECVSVALYGRPESCFGKYSYAYFVLSICLKGLIYFSKEADLTRTDLSRQ